MDDRQAYREKARSMGIPDAVCDWMLQLARPRVVLHRDDEAGAAADTSTALPAGYIGGSPWLPEDVEWAGFPHFMASIDCAALPPGSLDFPFPEDGHLLLFGNMDQPDFEGEDTYGRVVYVPAGTPTAERVLPEGETIVAERFPLRQELHWTLPGDWSFEYLLLSDKSRDLYNKYGGDAVANEPWAYSGKIALGGHAVSPQDDPLLRFLPDDFPYPSIPIDPRAKTAEAAARVPDDLPLPSLWAEPAPDTGGWLVLAEMRWEDTSSGGTVPAVTFWMIRRDDLAERNFDHVKHVVDIFE